MHPLSLISYSEAEQQQQQHIYLVTANVEVTEFVFCASHLFIYLFIYLFIIYQFIYLFIYNHCCLFGRLSWREL